MVDLKAVCLIVTLKLIVPGYIILSTQITVSGKTIEVL